MHTPTHFDPRFSIAIYIETETWLLNEETEDITMNLIYVKSKCDQHVTQTR